MRLVWVAIFMVAWILIRVIGASGGHGEKPGGGGDREHPCKTEEIGCR
jgi:hypothetical protein